jgi:DNA-binding PadR family transcriptional regulator
MNGNNAHALAAKRLIEATNAEAKGNEMKQNRSKDLRVRVIKNFTDILMLKYLKQNPKNSGYQILRSLHEKYNILFSPGTIYNEIYSLERKGFIASEGDETYRVYSLTEKGEQALDSMINEGKDVQELTAGIFQLP